MQKIKTNDQVVVLAGKDRGKKGKVTQVLPQDDLVVVEGVNAMHKHLKPNKRGDKGQRVDFFGPVKLSRVMLICPKCNKQVRVKINIEGEKKLRQCRKCQAMID